MGIWVYIKNKNYPQSMRWFHMHLRIWGLFLGSGQKDMPTLNKGLRTKSPGTNLKQIEPCIGPFFTLDLSSHSKKHFFSNECLKVWGSIPRSNIKKLWLTCEKIRLTFGLFFFSWFFLSFVFIFILCTWKGWKCTPFNNHLVGSTKPTMSILELVKNGGVGVLSITSSIHSMLFIFTKFEQQGEK